MKHFIKILIALLLLVSLLFLADVREMRDLILRIELSSLIYLIFISFVLVYVSALKWKMFLEALSAKASTLKLFSLYLVGYFVNLLLPSYVGGDIARSYYLGKQVGHHQALTGTILERYTGLVAMLVLGILASFLVPQVTLELKVAIGLLTCGLIVGTCMVMSKRFIKILDRITIIKSKISHISQVQDGLRFASSSPRLLLQTLGLSFLFHALTVVNTLAAAWAIGWVDVPVGELFVVLPLILLIGSLPITPSGLGIQEGAFFYFLQILGASPAEALAVALLLRAKSYLLAVIGSIVWLNLRKHK